MKRAEWFFIASIALLSVTMLVVSVTPGRLNDIAFFMMIPAIIVVPIVLIGFGIALVVLARRGKLATVRIPWRTAVLSSCLILGTLVLLKFYVPRRVAFAISRPAFEMSLQPGKHSGEHPRQLGVYSIDQRAVDPRGGTYYRVYAGLDGLGPDTTSYGFVHEPNSEGTPFGAKGYRVFNLGKQWHWFRASNDWH